MKKHSCIIVIFILSISSILSQSDDESPVNIYSNCTPFTITSHKILMKQTSEKRNWNGYLPKGTYNISFQCNNKTLSEDVHIRNEGDKHLNIYVDFNKETVTTGFETNLDIETVEDNEKNADTNIEQCSEEAFIIVEDMPKFQGNESSDSFSKYISRNLNYPPEAKNKHIEGKVYVRFTVNCHGEVVDASIIRSIDPLLDQEALRIVNESPSWTPGKQRGKAVNVQFTIPVEFSLK